MNERIRELKNQAWTLVSEEERARGELYEAQEQWELCDQKFAELIVKECCDVLQSETIRHDGYGYNQGFLHKKIKEHFGVEE
jgi:hypothetical protein